MVELSESEQFQRAYDELFHQILMNGKATVALDSVAVEIDYTSDGEE